MSPDPRAEIERDLRAALHAAADSVNPAATPFAPRAVSTGPSRRRAALGRLLAPAAVAAAVAAVAIPSLVMAARHDTSTATPAAAQPIAGESDGYVTAAGVRFPLPDGWTAHAVAQTKTAVTVCVAVHPAPECDGVTVRVAIPDADGDITPVPDPLTFEDPVLASAEAALETPSSTWDVAASTSAVASGESGAPEAPAGAVTGASGSRYDSSQDEGGVMSSSSAGTSYPSSEAIPAKPDPADSLCPMLEDTDPVGGRQAQHLMIGACAAGSPQAATWYVVDGSLSVASPRGRFAAEAALIAAGVDFSGYAHGFGPQIAYVTSADPVPQTSERPSSSATSSGSSGISGASTGPTGASSLGYPASSVTTATPAP